MWLFVKWWKVRPNLRFWDCNFILRLKSQIEFGTCMIWLHVRYGGWIVGFGSCTKSLVNKVITTTFIPASNPHVIHLEENRNVNVTSNNRGLVLPNITTQRLEINYNGFGSNGIEIEAAFIIAQYHTERNLHLDNWNFLCYTIFYQNIKG